MKNARGVKTMTRMKERHMMRNAPNAPNAPDAPKVLRGGVSLFFIP